MAGDVDGSEAGRIRGLELAAEAGDLDATYLLGLIAANGTTVSDPDPEKARELLAWASWHGHIEATFEYSLILRHGIGGPTDPETADRLERLAAEAGQPRACLNLGARPQAQRGDCEEAVTWYERAARGGNSDAALRLVQMFLWIGRINARALPARGPGGSCPGSVDSFSGVVTVSRPDKGLAVGRTRSMYVRPRDSIASVAHASHEVNREVSRPGAPLQDASGSGLLFPGCWASTWRCPRPTRPSARAGLVRPALRLGAPGLPQSAGHRA